MPISFLRSAAAGSWPRGLLHDGGAVSYRGPGVRSDYVMAAAPGCARDGCQISQAKVLLEAAKEIVKQGSREGMSEALWCDQGGHAFSVRDPGRQRVTITEVDEDTGQERPTARDFCGKCAADAGLLRPKRTSQAPGVPGATAEPRRPDPAYIKQLEVEAGITGDNPS